MMHKSMYAGIGGYLVSVNELSVDCSDYVKRSDFTFFKNKDGEYEFIKTRYGDSSNMFLSLDDMRRYLSIVSRKNIEFFVVKRASKQTLEEFRNIAIRKNHHGI